MKECCYPHQGLQRHFPVSRYSGKPVLKGMPQLFYYKAHQMQGNKLILILLYILKCLPDLSYQVF